MCMPWGSRALRWCSHSASVNKLRQDERNYKISTTTICTITFRTLSHHSRKIGGGKRISRHLFGQAARMKNLVSDCPTYQAQATNCGTVGLMNSRRPRILDSKLWFGLGVLAFCLGISVYVCRRDRVIAAREGTGVGIVTDRQTIRLGTRTIYTFSVNDQWFTGSNSSSMSDALWPGAQVSVYYDSRNPNENALIDFAELSQSPNRAVTTWWEAETSRGWLIGGGFLLFLAVIGTFTGETLARFQGVVRRAEDPRGFSSINTKR